jgi:hypothetical protein
LQIAGASERNVQSLEDLGLDALMDINPEQTTGQFPVGEIRDQLQPWKSDGVSGEQRSRMVLEAHQILSATNEENARRFEAVVQLLEKDVDQQTP